MRRKDTLIEYCANCGQPVHRYPSQRKRSERAFCSRTCHMALLNAELNPTRMTPEVREKLHLARLGSGEGITYTKQYGRHEHRCVAEKMLGRPLKDTEVVHHIDGNKRNNTPENLMIFESQAEHARWHAQHGDCFKRKKVTPDDLYPVQAPADRV